MTGSRYRRLRREALALAREHAAGRLGRPAFERAMAKLFADVAAPDALIAELVAEADQLRLWISGRSASPARRRFAVSIVAVAGAQFAQAEGKARTDLARGVLALVQQGKPQSEVVREARRRVGTARRYAETVAATAAGAVDRAETAAAAAEAYGEAGARFRYAGPPPDRPFCREMMRRSADGETFSLAQIAALDNGQNLDPLLYCGGYNCRHRWLVTTPVA